MSYGLVDYDYDTDVNAEVDEYTKEKAYSYQKESRIAINMQGKKSQYEKGKRMLFITLSRELLKLTWVLYVILHFPFK